MPTAQATITIVTHGRVLVSGAAFRAGVLPYLCHLIACVVNRDGRRIDAAALPVQRFFFDRPSEDVGIKFPLATLGDTRIERTLVGHGHDLAARTTATRVGKCFRGQIGIGGD